MCPVGDSTRECFPLLKPHILLNRYFDNVLFLVQIFGLFSDLNNALRGIDPIVNCKAASA